MRLFIPHPFKNHDKFFRIRFNYPMYIIPWYSRIVDDTLPDDEVIDNYIGWLCVAVHWYSSK